MPAIVVTESRSIARRNDCAWAVLLAACSALLVACAGEKTDSAAIPGGGQSTSVSEPDAAAGGTQSGNGGTVSGAGSDGVGIDAGAYPSTDGGLCIPGVPRCHGDFGYQQCEQDGTWGAPHSCAGYSSDGTSSYCVMTPGTETNEPWAACVDPACWYWITRGFVPG
ncbi:MAG TPA: hypothetical protein VHO25_20170, partial [Polyangiaceae bacterium]|nr:hypothetical protein [Polyangiaceae bacterium]